MIKFFRKIRQRLINESKFSKYLIYAIGEITLVVIGILIALQINNWNQQKIDNSKERTYLINLQNELLGNTELNQRLLIDRMDSKIEGLKLAKKYCEDGLEIKDTLDFLNKITYGGVFSGGFLMGVRSYYDELLSTGNLQLIKNDSIKNIIAEYYARVDFFTMRSKDFATQFANYTGELRPFNKDNPSLISKYDQIEMIEAFKSEEFRRMVDGELSYAYALHNYVNSLEKRSKLINDLISEELKK